MAKNLIERSKIANEVGRRPYASRVEIVLGDSIQFGFDGEASLLIDYPCIVRLEPRLTALGDRQVQRLTGVVEAFPAASDAEQAGLRFALAMLWVAISMNCSLRLEYHTPLPSIVYDRTTRGGISLSGSAHVVWQPAAAGVVELLEQIFRANVAISKPLLVSMELFASARLEVTERTRFLGLVSSLEPLADQQRLGGEVEGLVESYVSQLRSTPGMPARIRSSLEGRIRELSRESISQAISRLVREYLPDDDIALEVIREAYDIRSKMLHAGYTDADLTQKTRQVQTVLRRLYSSMLGLELRAPAA